MDSFQALGLCENALRFNVEVTFPNKQIHVFEVLTRYTVDKVKTIALAQIPTLEIVPNDYLLGLSESEKLDIEFAKFIESHPKIKEALESDELVKVGLFRRGVGSPLMPREKIVLNADIDMAALRSNLEAVMLTPKDKGLKLQRRNSLSTIKEPDSPKLGKKSTLSSFSFSTLRLGKNKPIPDGMSRSSSTPQLHDPMLASPSAKPGSMRVIKPRNSTSALLSQSAQSSPRIAPSPQRAVFPSIDQSFQDESNSPPQSPTQSPVLLSRSAPFPLQSEIVQTKGFTYEEGTPGVELDQSTLAITDPIKSQPWYSIYFYNKEHFNYIGNDGTTDTFIVSVIKDSSPDIVYPDLSKEKDKSVWTSFRVVIRTKKGDDKQCAMVKGYGLFSSKKKPPIKDIIQSACPMLAGKKLRNIKDTDVCSELKTFEDKQLIRNYKFGVLYCAEGQTEEEQMFSNVSGSADWEEFLDTLGTKVVLQGWPNYRAGLDVKAGSTGTHSVHTYFKDYEVMFHVSTCLPFDAVNPQQLERKRHLGNDIVVIIFKEGAQQYDPNCIKSEFNHIFIVVSKVKIPNNPTTYYKLNIACKEGVPPFGPDLPDPPIIEKSLFREYILCKLINGENTSYEAPAFKMKIQRTRLTLLKDIASRLQ